MLEIDCGLPCHFGCLIQSALMHYFYFSQNLSFPEILVEVEKRGSSFDQLLTIPEQDDWLYTDGKSVSCVAFILEMYKEAGLFDPIASSIQVTEFTDSIHYKFQSSFVSIKQLTVFCIFKSSVKRQKLLITRVYKRSVIHSF